MDDDPNSKLDIKPITIDAIGFPYIGTSTAKKISYKPDTIWHLLDIYFHTNFSYGKNAQKVTGSEPEK